MKAYIYYIYAIFLSKYSSRQKANNIQHLSNDTLYALNHHLNQPQNDSTYVYVQDRVSMLIGRSLLYIIDKFGKPYCFRTEKKEGIRYEVLLYKKQIRGLKTRITYHFLNGELVMLNYYFKKEHPEDLARMNKVIGKLFGINVSGKDLFTATDCSNNAIEFENTIDLRITLRTRDPQVLKLISKSGYKHSTKAYVKPVTNYELVM
jgi:hypothetical protein